MKNQEKGKLGEQIAYNFLVKHHYTILKQNYRVGRNEIDLIVQKEDLIIFVEVKLRQTNHYGFPEEQVNAKKEKSIRQAAEHFLNENPQFFNIRFDIVSITLFPQTEIVHLQDVF